MSGRLSALEPPFLMLRRASRADAEQLSRFAARVFYETFAHTATEADMRKYVSEAFSPAIQADEIADDHATVILAENAAKTLFGYAYFIKEPTSIELRRIYVAASFQGRGLAKRLLDEVIGVARERRATRLWLSVWHRNERAIAFYRKHGFLISNTLSFDWGDGDKEAGLIMEMTLFDGRSSTAVR